MLRFPLQRIMPEPAMKILAHRGLWREVSEQNSLVACRRALDLGYGIEIDIRDDGGRLVVAHEPGEKTAYPFQELCALLSEYPHCCAAINIKSCGLQALLKPLLEAHAVSNYFTFDLAIPDMLANIRHGIATFTRQSEYEPEPALYAQSTGVWLDSFEKDFDKTTQLAYHAKNGKSVAIVSPELHGRQHIYPWQKLKNTVKAWGKDHSAGSSLYLCTDHPQAAQHFFDA